IRGQSFRARITALGILFQALEANGLQGAIELWSQRSQSTRFVMHDSAQHLHFRFALERWQTDEQLVENGAQTIDIRSRGGLFGLSERLFRRHVVRSSHDPRTPR